MNFPVYTCVNKHQDPKTSFSFIKHINNVSELEDWFSNTSSSH